MLKSAFPFIAGIGTAILFLLIRNYSLRMQMNPSSNKDNVVTSTSTLVAQISIDFNEIAKRFEQQYGTNESFLTTTESFLPITSIATANKNSIATSIKKQPKCRHRWTRFLEQNTIKVPSQLQEWFDRYNRLHDRMLREQSIEESLRAPLNSPTNRIRYLVWVPTGLDYGGHLLSLLSTYLLALLTDRVLLVVAMGEADVFCEPFSRSSWILPKALQSRLLAEDESVPRAGQAFKARQPLRVASLEVRRGRTGDEKHLLSCHGSLKDLLGHLQWLVVRADMPWAEYLFANPSHAAKLKGLFGEGMEPYRILLQQLIHPSNLVWERITAMYHSYYTDEYDKPYRIATYLEPAAVASSGFTPFRQSLEERAGPVLGTFGSRVSLYFSPSNSTYDPERWAARHFPNEQTHLLGAAAIMWPGQDGWIVGWRRALIDLWMISWSHDYLFTSSSIDRSSFLGWLGYLQRGKPAHEIVQEASGCRLVPLGAPNGPSSPLEPIDCEAIRMKK